MRLPHTRIPIYGMLLQSGMARLSDQMSAVVYGWGFLQETGSSLASGIIMASSLIALVIGTLFAGRLIAAFGARRIVLWGNWVSCIAAAMIALCFALGFAGPILVAVIAALGAVLDGPAGIASETNYPAIARMGRFDLMRFNALDDSLDHGASLIAPALGAGAIAAVSVSGAMWFLAGLGLMAAMLSTAVLPAFKSDPKAASVSLRSAYEYLRSDAILFRLTVLFCAVIAIFVSVELVLLPRAISEAGLSSGTLASVLFGAGFGGLGGASAANAVSRRVALPYLAGLVFALLGAGIAIMAFAGTATAFCTSGLLAGAGSGLISAPVATLLQTRPPAALRADVQALAASLSLAATPITVLFYAVLADALDIAVLLAGSAGLMGALTIVAVLWVPGRSP
jgi:MFS family permease